MLRLKVLLFFTFSLPVMAGVGGGGTTMRFETPGHHIPRVANFISLLEKTGDLELKEDSALGGEKTRLILGDEENLPGVEARAINRRKRTFVK